MAATIDNQVAELERANAELRRQLDACSAELKEARDQQTATAEVLQVINSSPGELAPVFDAMLDKAMRLCEAAFGVLWAYEGNRYCAAAVRGAPLAFVEFLRQPLQPHYDPGSGLERALRGEDLVINDDMAAEEIYRHGDPLRRAIVDMGGARSHILVALRKDETLLGAITIYRQEVRPFTDKQIALLQNFAVQAVIAMENARLITETREALEQQTATAEVLQVINSSPGDLAPVFDAMLEKAMHLCGAAFGTLWTYDGDRFRPMAYRGVPARYAEFLEHNAPLASAGTGRARILAGERVIHVSDLADEKPYRAGDPHRRALVDLGGARTGLIVPLLKHEEVLGYIRIYRQEVRPFSDKQIALLQNFAAQAVIAMENARLLTETRDALEQQTATAEVLPVINSSPGDVVPVFEAILEKAHTLCEAAHGALTTYDGEYFRAVALRGMPEPFAELLRQPFRPREAQERLLQGERLIHIPDIATLEPAPPIQQASLDAGVRTLLMVPLRKDDVLLGYITAHRREVRPFSDRQIALLENFAAQAVIAMENARLITETREALEQQTATAEVLQVINSSPGDLAPVFDAMLEKALHLCGAPYGILWNYDGEFFEVAAQRGVPKAFLDTMSGPQRPTSPETTRGRLVAGEHVVHITNLGADLLYQSGDQHRRALVDAAGAQVVVAVSLRKDDKLLGAFTIYRQEARPFTDKQIALVTTFADQAVIAMENARLITETREALEQQTATAEVLQVINSSPGDLAPVFDAMLEKAMRLCRIALGALELHENGKFRAVAVRGVSGPLAELLRQPFEPPPESPLARLIAGEKVVQITDMSELARLRPDDPRAQAGAQYGLHTALFVPLRKDAELLGQIVAFRQEVRPFSEKEIALLQNFAAQAVIAMENARLITETQEALEQQTATAEVLQVINSSPGDLAPVFDAMLEKATRLCEAPFGILRTWDGERLHFGAVHGDLQFSDWVRQRGPIRPDSDRSPMGRILAGERVVSVADAPGDEGYRTSAGWREMVEASGVRSAIWVALHKDDALLGYITVYRQEVRPFSEKQIALLQNFAAQAVIAMENARLLTETREALEQQTATAEVLQVINSSPGELTPVFDVVLEKATRACDAAFGTLWTYDGERFRAIALRQVPEAYAEFLSQAPIRPVPFSGLGRVAAGESVAHFVDVAANEAYRGGDPQLHALLDLGKARSTVAVPLRKDNVVLGAITAYRQEVRPFSEKQIALLHNFAAQAVIAMENARLLTETREALDQQTATAEVLQVINSSPGELAPVFDAMLDKAMRLCGVDHAALELYDGERMHAVAVQGASDKFAETLRQGYPATESPASRTLLEGGSFVEIADAAQIDQTAFRTAAAVDGIRTVLFVPLRRDDVFRGMIASARREVRPFSEKEIALLQNFAAQAVIAMENARLITETREALEQQTATAEVLQVINSSPGDLAPVFDAMVERSARLCEANEAALRTFDGELLHVVSVHGSEPEVVDRLRQLGPTRAFGLYEPFARGERVVHIADVRETDIFRDNSVVRERLELRGIRTWLAVALQKEEVLLGVINVHRRTVQPFSDKQIALLQNFAAQAVIAMENARLITETREALEQQTATAEVLQVINSSPGDLAPVFDAMLEKAMRLCEAAFGTLWTYDGDRFRSVAQRGVPGPYADYLTDNAPPASAGTGRARILRGEPFVHVADLKNEEPYRAGDPHRRAMVDLGGARTGLIVPLRKDDAVIGFVMIYRQQVRPFAEKEIALLQNFAAQAVIAMENARLLTETREALEQQTATAEILQVINSSPGDLAPVFDAMLQKALALCGAAFGVLWTYNGEQVQAAALRGVPPRFAEFLTRAPHPVGPDNAHGRLLASEPVVHIADVAEDEAYRSGDPTRRTLVEVGGGRTLLAVPLRRDSRFLGDFVIYRTEVQPFSSKQIALLQNFAAQAVIAMENARLLNELRQRTSDLQEALDYQTATSDVLKVISQSNFDLGPVLGNVIETALRLCRAHMGSIFRLEDGVYRWAVGRGLEPAYQEIEMRTPILAGPGTVVGRAALEGRAVQIADAMADPLYAVKDEASLARARTMLGVPLLREGAPIGVIAMARDRVEPFSEREIALVTTFADQAVIAIENARLFDELRERTAELGRSVEELKMLGEVGRAVSSTLDLSAVLSTILTASLGVTWATAGAIFRYIRAERAFRLVEAVGWDEALLGSVGDLNIAETETAMSEAALRRTPIQLTDLAELPSTPLRDASLAAGLRSVLIVPLVGPERIFGALVLQRREAGEFPAETVRLMQTLASQSVLAIQNARLFREIADKSEQLALASEHKSQFLANMSHELRTPLNAILGYAELLVDGIYGVLPEKAQGVLDRVQNNGQHLLALINDVLDLAKIEAGQLTLTLEDYALAEVVRGVVTATEPLAVAKGLKFTAVVQEGMPMAHGDARRVSQVLLNLAGNAIKFTDAGEVEINASAAAGQFVLTVRDTGPGIADADQERIFGEFQQIDNSDTRKKGGTGLGLSISKRMVEIQGGMISVDSVLGAGSTFRVVLPVHVEPALEEAA